MHRIRHGSTGGPDLGQNRPQPTLGGNQARGAFCNFEDAGDVLDRRVCPRRAVFRWGSVEELKDLARERERETEMTR